MAAMLFFAIVFTVVIVAAFVWLMLVIFQEGPKPQDFTIVDNFMPQYTSGFSQGILLEVDKGQDRDGYIFVPKDIDYYGRKKNKNMAKVEPQIVYAEKRKVISFPRGTFSGERNRVWILPPNPEDLSEELKGTKLGKTIMAMIDDINNDDTEVKSIREGSNRLRRIYERMGDGEISSAELDRMDQAHSAIVKQSSRTEDKKIGPGSPPQLGGGGA